MNTCTVSDMILIASSRLQELEELEKNLPTMIENALKEHKANALKRLHEKDKENPTAVNIRVKRYAEKHREMINLKRREKRKKLKSDADGVSDDVLVNNTDPHTPKVSPIIAPLPTVVPPSVIHLPTQVLPKRDTPVGGITVRFAD